jgi:hypothetical protein
VRQSWGSDTGAQLDNIRSSSALHAFLNLCQLTFGTPGREVILRHTFALRRFLALLRPPGVAHRRFEAESLDDLSCPFFVAAGLAAIHAATQVDEFRLPQRLVDQCRPIERLLHRPGVQLQSGSIGANSPPNARPSPRLRLLHNFRPQLLASAYRITVSKW